MFNKTNFNNFKNFPNRYSKLVQKNIHDNEPRRRTEEKKKKNSRNLWNLSNNFLHGHGSWKKRRFESRVNTAKEGGEVGSCWY